MKIKLLPNFENYYGFVNGLTPSNFYRIRNGCSFPIAIYQIIKDNNLDWSILLPNLSKAAHLGTIIHRLFEERVKGEIQNEEEYEIKWEHYVEQEEAKIKQNYPSISGVSFSDYDKLYESCDSTMKIEPLSTVDRSQTSSENRRTLEANVSYEGYIYGTIDRLIFHDNSIEIIDYKSGEIFDEKGNIKDSISYQLNLYAICCEYQFNIPVKKLTIIRTSDLTEIEIPIQRDNFELYLNNIKNIIDKINYAIANKSIEALQTPNADLCGFCNCRHICNNYLRSALRSDNIVDGIVTDCSNKNYLELIDSTGNKFVVNKLGELNIEDWDSLFNKHLIFINVSSRIEDVYKRTNRTLIYQIKK